MPRRGPAGAKAPSTGEALRAQGVLLEQLGSQMSLVLEAVTSSKAELEASMRALEDRLSQRITMLEEAVRQLAAEQRALREEVARLRRDFDQREERGRVSALEVRVAALEARLGIGSR